MSNTQLSDRIIAFTHHLRANGHVIGVKELTDSLHIISALEQPDEKTTRHYLRTLYCRNQGEWRNFDSVFDLFWYPKPKHKDDASSDPASGLNGDNKTQGGGISGIGGTSTNHFEAIASANSGGAGKQNTITKADFRFLNNQHAMREAENLAENLAARLKARNRIQRRIMSTGSRIDMRQTIRRNMSCGGNPLYPRYKVPYKKTPHLLILHDVSHSMNWNNPLLFRFARGLIKVCPESDAFVFHTQLFCVTELYREKSIQQMREKLESNNHLWLGGTCIAESLDEFNQQYAKTTLKKDTVVIIISDGLDTNAPEYLGAQLKQLKQKSKQVLWLNPMLGREGYSMKTETLSSIKPYVDHFAAAHSVDALRDVIYSINI